MGLQQPNAPALIPPGPPEIRMIEVHYWLRLLATEVAWLTETAGRLASGDLEVRV